MHQPAVITVLHKTYNGGGNEGGSGKQPRTPKLGL